MTRTKNDKTLHTASVPFGPSIIRFNKIVYDHTNESRSILQFRLGPLSFDIHKNELLGIVGPSGSGKTTLLRLLAGLTWPHDGKILIYDNVVSSTKMCTLPEKRKIGMVFQDGALFPHLTIRNNILFGIRKWDKSEQERRLVELEDLLGLRKLGNRYPHELSGGQQQRVALARTLAPKPAIILLDEPLSSIDADLRSNLAQKLRKILKDLHTTALWVTHDQDEAFDIADRVAVMNEGQIEQIDFPLSIYNHPETRFVADFIGKAVFLNGEVKKKTVLTEIGTLTNMDIDDYPEGSSIEIMLRPSDIEIIPYDGGLGTVAKRQFQGEKQLYTIQLPSGQKILSYQETNIIWPLGTKVRVNMKMKNTIFFPSRCPVVHKPNKDK